MGRPSAVAMAVLLLASLFTLAPCKRTLARALAVPARHAAVSSPGGPLAGAPPQYTALCSTVAPVVRAPRSSARFTPLPAPLPATPAVALPPPGLLPAAHARAGAGPHPVFLGDGFPGRPREP